MQSGCNIKEVLSCSSYWIHLLSVIDGIIHVDQSRGFIFLPEQSL